MKKEWLWGPGRIAPEHKGLSKREYLERLATVREAYLGKLLRNLKPDDVPYVCRLEKARFAFLAELDGVPDDAFAAPRNDVPACRDCPNQESCEAKGVCDGWSQANKNTNVRPASKMLSAISFGVFCRVAPSTRAIMRSRKDSPGLAVMRTTMRSDKTLVPPVTAERSPPLSRITGADSPVIADSSTEAMPSMTSPSPGMISPASTTTVSPLRSSYAAIVSSFFPFTSRRALVSWRILRKKAAWALPRPSATASAKLAKTTVNHSQKLTLKVNQSGCDPAVGAIMSRNQISVVSTLPISTTNMTGFLITCCGASLRKLSPTAGHTISGSKSERSLKRVSAMLVNLSCLS